MRIVISGAFWQEPHVGSGQYLHNLIREYGREEEERFVLVIPRYTHPSRPRLRNVQTVLMPTPFDRHNRDLAKVWFEQIALLQVVRKVRAECVHVPYWGSPLRVAVPTVVSVLDLIPVVLPAYRGGRLVRLYTRLATKAAQRATRMIAISEHGKQDMVTHLGVPAERIVVTPLAAAPTCVPQPPAVVAAVRERFQLQHAYVFYIGGFDLRKNVALLIRAFAQLPQSLAQPLHLVLAGRAVGTNPALFPDLQRVILEAGVSARVVLLGMINEEEKAALLTGCAAFAFPSAYEGFGLTPLEAMQCGAPVIAASTTSVGEVVGDGGLLVAPDDEAAWTAALAQVVGDPQLADDLRRRGQARAAQFDWRKTAAMTRTVYADVRR